MPRNHDGVKEEIDNHIDVLFDNILQDRSWDGPSTVPDDNEQFSLARGWQHRPHTAPQSITGEQGDLLARLRSHSWFMPSWLEQLIKLRRRKGVERNNVELDMEYETVGRVKQTFKNSVDDDIRLLGLRQSERTAIHQIVAGLKSPRAVTRKITTEILAFLVYYRKGEAHGTVLGALVELSKANNDDATPHAYWLKY
ncbi:hypothetical protein NEOLEDRAFT_1170383 [Neolentinus lepideus HHB14362 ss-1]|uniref:Uncharacterized protein n=1 Tax=Neolentinus lepideus HHB14362 ss-1 TaxID=1314782 RepID=A0A165RPW3_9AGAM|nr:hypothetical protein NEOLEDRAFT_1170383 [Neolentinus lepideus HHB14362 ss-1]